MLYQFTYGDPDGNGQDDTYGLALSKFTAPLDIMQTWFGAPNGWGERDGKLVPVHQTAEYKEALDWMRKIYADGLVRPDWATVDTANFQHTNPDHSGIPCIETVPPLSRGVVDNLTTVPANGVDHI